MANFSITINESLRTFGGAPADQFGLYNWGAFLWGEGTTAQIVNTSPGVFDTLVLTDNVTPVYTIGMIISETLTLLDAVGAEYLQSGNWDYIFPSNTSDFTQGSSPTYSEVASGATGWSSLSVTTTNWS